MSEPKEKHSAEKKQAEKSETPNFDFASPSDIPAFSFGPAPVAFEIKPFVFGSESTGVASVGTTENGLSHTASISALMEQRSKMANARRSKQNDKTAASANASDTKPFAFKTDSTEKGKTTGIPYECGPFVIGGSRFSPSSASSSSTPRQRKPTAAGRGRRKKSDAKKKSKNGAAMVITPDDVDKAIASFPSPVISNASASFPPRTFPRDEEPELAPEPKGPFQRAPESELRKRKVVRVRQDTNSMRSQAASASVAAASSPSVAAVDNDENGSTSQRASSEVLQYRRLVRAAKRETNAASSVTSDSATNGNVASIVSDDNDDDSMPPLEPSNTEAKSEAATEENEDEGSDNNSDGDDEASDDSGDARENPFAALQEDSSESEEEDEESSEEEEESDEESEEEDSEEEECMCDACVADRFNDMLAAALHDGDDDGEAESDEQCCICFGAPSYSNRMAVLPCCESENGEASSMQFCNRCVVKCLKSQNSESATLYDYFMDYYIGECPRCRSLISVSKRDSRSTARRNIVECPSFRQAVRYALRDQEKGLRPLLYTACCVYPKFMPVELFEDEEDKARQLCRWGIFKEVRKKEVYAIDPQKQDILRGIAEARFAESDDEDEDNSPFSTTTIITMRACVQLFIASFYAVMKFKVIVACRMFNQGIATFMVGVGALPRGLHRWWQGTIVTCLNMMLLTMIFQVAFLLVAYIAVGYGSVKLAGWWLSTPDWKSLSRRLFYTWVGIAVAAGIYHVNKYDLVTYSSATIVLFAGGCHFSKTSMSNTLRMIWRKLP